jgi:hypothetical protein
MPSDSPQLSLLDLLMALDDAGCGEMASDGSRIYIFGKGQIPPELIPTWERMKPELLKRLPRLPMCHCPTCGGRPLLGKVV